MSEKHTSVCISDWRIITTWVRGAYQRPYNLLICKTWN